MTGCLVSCVSNWEQIFLTMSPGETYGDTCVTEHDRSDSEGGGMMMMMMMMMMDVCVCVCVCGGGGGGGGGGGDGGWGLLVWSGIGHGRNGLLVLNGTLKVQRYVDKVILPEVVPCIQGDGLIVQQNDAYLLSICLTQDFPTSNAVRTLSWPAY